MRKFLLIGLALIFAVWAKAENKSLFITFNNGSTVEFALATTPEIMVANDKLTVTSTSLTVSYDLYTVSTFTYGTTTGIKATQGSNGLAIKGNRIILSGTVHAVHAFAIDGKAISLTPVVLGNETIISLDPLPQGVYIIKVNGQSIKIAKK
mgnify:CR=1 FL=1